MKIPLFFSFALVSLNLSLAQAQIDPQACRKATQNGYLVQNLYSQSEVSLLNLEGAQQIFEETKKPHYRLPFLAAERNCELRAHKISHLFYSRFGGIKTVKVLIETKGTTLNDGTFFSQAQLSGYSSATQRGYTWDYHTAPALCVRTASGKDELYVFDPSLFNGPVPYNQWKSQITAGLNPNHYSESSYGMYSIAAETQHGVKTSFDSYDLERTESLLRRDWSEHQSLMRQQR